jgi:hypothetical protein
MQHLGGARSEAGTTPWLVYSSLLRWNRIDSNPVEDGLMHAIPW